MTKLTVVAAQVNLLVGDIEGNTDRIIAVAKKAQQECSADVVLFPELSITGYPPEDLLLRPTLYQRVGRALETLAEELPSLTVVVGYPQQIGEHCYNSAVVIQNGKLIKHYAKHSLPNYLVFDEKRYFSPGTEAAVFSVKDIAIGIIICADTWDDAPAEQSKKAGAQLIVSLNASPFTLNKYQARREMLQQRSKSLGLPIIYLNSVGGQDELIFDGGSMVYDAHGKLMQQAYFYQETLLKTQWELKNHQASLIGNTHTIEELTEDAQLYQALVLGVRDYVKKNRFTSVIIGLSGGVDSALTLAIACDALGSDAVHAVMMPSQHTATMSKEDAKAQALTLKCHYSVISIEAIFSAFQDALTDEFKENKTDTTEENLQARCRGSLLMALSNKKGALVLTTGNKSEMAVGYATLYGDMAGGFAVLKDVYKTRVYELCRYRNRISKVIPERVLQRPPSAELAPNQVDQDSLPPYAILDEILQRFIDLKQDALCIAKAGIDITLVKKVIAMIHRNEYKRRQAPVGIRLTQSAFGKDWRYPITSGYFVG